MARLPCQVCHVRQSSRDGGAARGGSHRKPRPYLPLYSPLKSLFLPYPPTTRPQLSLCHSLAVTLFSIPFFFSFPLFTSRSITVVGLLLALPSYPLPSFSFYFFSHPVRHFLSVVIFSYPLPLTFSPLSLFFFLFFISFSVRYFSPLTVVSPASGAPATFFHSVFSFSLFSFFRPFPPLSGKYWFGNRPAVDL